VGPTPQLALVVLTDRRRLRVLFQLGVGLVVAMGALEVGERVDMAPGGKVDLGAVAVEVAQLLEQLLPTVLPIQYGTQMERLNFR
jgi:hypothetical protein